MLDDYEFALCLTHDVDRPYKTVQAPYYALRERRLEHLLDVLPWRNPYWQFDRVASIEASLGVRSAFYFLDEPSLLRKGPRAWLRPTDWVQELGRYAIDSPAISETIRELDAGGWEIGLHGSSHSYADATRLRVEKDALEGVLGHRVIGCRQHYLNLDVPETWHRQADVGLRYDASFGSATVFGFRYGVRPFRPFDGRFVVFPLTAMEVTLPDPGDRFPAARDACASLLAEADDADAVMTVLWHPRFFSDAEFPGYRRLYEWLVAEALDRGAWVGPPGELYRRLDIDTIDVIDAAQERLPGSEA